MRAVITTREGRGVVVAETAQRNAKDQTSLRLRLILSKLLQELFPDLMLKSQPNSLTWQRAMTMVTRMMTQKTDLHRQTCLRLLIICKRRQMIRIAQKWKLIRCPSFSSFWLVIALVFALLGRLLAGLCAAGTYKSILYCLKKYLQFL
jgi:hypothetical protein